MLKKILIEKKKKYFWDFYIIIALPEAFILFENKGSNTFYFKFFQFLKLKKEIRKRDFDRLLIFKILHMKCFLICAFNISQAV